MSRRHTCCRLLAGVLSTFLIVSVSAGDDPPFAHFEAGVDELSWVDTYLLAMASGDAYRGRVKDLEGDTFVEKFRHSYEPLGLEVLAFVEGGEARTGAQALVLRNEAIVLVVFCGSEGHDTTAAMRDWLTNARISQLELYGLRVHSGFYQALESVWEELLAATAGPRQQGLELWLTGHSLGGALANLAAYRASREGLQVGGVYTFASPKIGDADFVADFECRLGARSQQWSTALDPITRVPEMGDRTAYELLGGNHMVHASGEVEQVTELEMSGVPNPNAHRVSAYVNYLYRALPQEVRVKVPKPPPLCAANTRQVGLHPEDGFPLCRDSIRRIRHRRCLELGGEIVESPGKGAAATWCLRDDEGKFRYLARKLKAEAR